MKDAFSRNVVTFLSLRAGVECFRVQGWNISRTTKAEPTRCEFVNIRRVALLTICPLLVQATVNLKLYFLVSLSVFVFVFVFVFLVCICIYICMQTIAGPQLGINFYMCEEMRN